MKILALDQATKVSGFSVWEDDELLYQGLLNTNIQENRPFLRMQEFKRLLKNLIITEHPDHLVFESVQFQRNYNTYLQLGQLQGIIISLCFDYELPFDIVSASAWRSLLGIKGKKRDELKNNAIQYVEKKYNTSCTNDEADAICIGAWGVHKLMNENKE